MANWERVVEILQMVFGYVRLLVECTWQTVVLIAKRNGDFRRIGPVDVLCKAF